MNVLRFFHGLSVVFGLFFIGQIARAGDRESIQQVRQYGQEEISVKDFSQVTSVAEFNDVKPTDWAFLALQSLVERYGCIVGYATNPPAYKSHRTLTRYEFAAGLNACLDRINELLKTAVEPLATKAEMLTLQRLQEEFAPELAVLRGRVDTLESRTATLEAQQFSTTTKLYGQLILGMQGRLANTSDLAPRDGRPDTDDPSTAVTFGYNLQLALVTQFTDRSILLTGLQAGDLSTGAGFNNLPFFLNDTYTRLGYELNTLGNLRLSDLTYRWQARDDFAIIVGALGVSPVTVFRGPNRYESAGQGPISQFAQRNPIINLGNVETGAGFDWQVSDRFSIQAVYGAGNRATPASIPAVGTRTGGLFGGPFTFGIQFAAIPVDQLDVTVYYLNSYSDNAFLNTGVGDDLIGFIGSSWSTNAVGSTVLWRVSRRFQVGGWVGYANSQVQNESFDGTVETLNWMTFLNFPDLFGSGNLAGIYVGQPPKITSSDIRTSVGGIETLNIPGTVSGNGGLAGGQPGSTTHLELFYRWRLSRFISITPGVIFIFDPAQTEGSDTITVGVLRTTFTF